LYVYKEGGGCNCGMGGSEGEIIWEHSRGIH
jgi:hypothetical protein